MRILLLGAGGQVGRELQGPLETFADVQALGREALDYADLDALRRTVRDSRADVVVNAVAYNEVDLAEASPEAARRVNTEAVQALGEECKAAGAGLVHYSTDFVFDGKAERPYRESDPVGPLGAYARSKVDGENALLGLDAPALTFRTAWVYSLTRRSFVSSMLRFARERETMRVVKDQLGSPTFARDLAVATAFVLHGVRKAPYEGLRDARGIYHLAGSGIASRFELAEAALALDPRKAEHKVKEVLAIPAAEFPLPAARPAYTPLDCSKAKERFDVALPEWRGALGRAFRG